jgi:hypothetical protein
MLLTNASDDDSVGRLLRMSLRHWLIDQVRKTGRGALRRRLERLISEDERFETVPVGQPGAGRWRLARGNGLPAGPPLAALRAAAWGIRDVRVPPWTSKERRAPAADEPSLGRIMSAVLMAAGGSLEPETVVAVFADRLPNALDPAEEPLTGEVADGLASRLDALDPAQAAVDREQAGYAAQLARDVFAQLSAEERRLLPQLNDAIDAQMKAIGRGRSQTYLRVGALKERLRAPLGEEDDQALVIGELLRLCGGRVDLAPDSRADVPSIPGGR